MANTKKRFLSLLMAMVMILGLLPTSAFATQVTPEEAASRDSQYSVRITVKKDEKFLAGKTVNLKL
ncbi:MAG: hypothetical protein RR350_05515, partial [Oscillibacter sp.]